MPIYSKMILGLLKAEISQHSKHSLSNKGLPDICQDIFRVFEAY